MTKPTVTPVNAVSIEATSEKMDRIDAITEVFTQIMGEEIIVDTRTFGDDDGSLAILANILEVAEDDIRERLVCVYR